MESETTLEIVCETSACANNGKVIETILVDSDEVDSVIESFGHPFYPEEYCPICKKAGVLHE